MSAVNVAFDPFADDNLLVGGGERRLTVLRAFTQRSLMGTDEKPWIDPKTNERGVRNELVITYLDNNEQEREERWSAGGLTPTADGEGFELIDGKLPKFNSKSQIAEFGKALKNAGFDTTKLVVDGRYKFSVLNGAQITFVGVAKKDAQGNIKTYTSKQNGKVYEDRQLYPQTFHGYVGAAAAANGNGADHVAADAAIKAAVEKAGGSISQADLVRQLGDHSVVQYMLRTAGGEGWTKQGSTYSLAN